MNYTDGPVIRGPRTNQLWPSSITMDQIVAILRQRRSMDAKLIQAMIEIRDRYNGEVVTPLPDVAGYEAMQRPGPNFIQEAIDGAARRANSRLPRIYCPPANPESDTERKKAEIRRDAIYGRWYTSQWDLKLGRAYRHWFGYGTCAMMAMPDDRRGHATLEIRDPLTAYPELRAPDDVRNPDNIGFLFGRSADWIRAHYPEAEDYVINAPGRSWDTLWDMVEWIDGREIVVGIMGPRMPAYAYQDSRPYGYTAYELRRWPNKAGMVPVVVPRRVTLDQIMGQLQAVVGYTDLFARLMALAIVADEKATFPDMAIISKTGLPPQLVSGRWKDGRSGEVNLITDAQVEVITKSTGTSTMPMLEATEAHLRSSAGASPLYGGNAGGMGRTGAAIDSLGSFAIDPLVQEGQMSMARSLGSLNEGLMAVEEGYFGDSKFTVILGLRGSEKSVTYTPSVHFRYKQNIVAYPFPGADVNQLSVALAQMVTTEMLSKRTARYQHPLVDDADQEEEWVNADAIEGALRDGFATQIAQGALPVPIAARVITLVKDDGKDLANAILQATAEAAAQGPAPGTPEGPETPALAPPGGAPGGPPGAPAPGGGPGGQMSPALAQMLAAMGAGPQAGAGAPQPAAPPSLMDLRHVLQGVNENVSSAAV